MSKAFNSFKNKIMGLFKRESFNPTEQAFNGGYRSFRINGVERMDPHTLFERIR